MSAKYQLMPFTFARHGDEVLVVSQAGEYLFLPGTAFTELVGGSLSSDQEVFLDLKAKHILTDTQVDPVVEFLATKLRTKKSFLNHFTALHMVIPTLRCNSNCRYCHASAQGTEETDFDMSEDTASKVIETIFQSPSPVIKIEFQGGDPLLRFDMVKLIISLAERANRDAGKYLEFVICTNMTNLTKKMLRYMSKHQCVISTSLDGPKDLHDKHRVLRNGSPSYDQVVEKIALARRFLGHDKVAALMTATRDSLGRFPEIVDEYVSLGFHSVFFRALNPYGFAHKERSLLAYPTEEFIDAYKQGLNRVIEHNLNGYQISEVYAEILLRRILTPFGTGFVDLQSPSGAGISGVIYNYDGNVFLSDEGRMLSMMGDNRFLMGNVVSNSYREIFRGERITEAVKSSCVETLPECSYCAFQMYCGSDPVRSYTTQGDLIGHRPTSDFCQRNKALIGYFLDLIRSGSDDMLDIFWSWVTHRSLQEMRKADIND